MLVTSVKRVKILTVVSVGTWCNSRSNTGTWKNAKENHRARYNGIWISEICVENILYIQAQEIIDKWPVEVKMPHLPLPQFIGSIWLPMETKVGHIQGLRFVEDHQGCLWIWKKHKWARNEKVNKSLSCCWLDIGGRSAKADFSVITVFDRFSWWTVISRLLLHNGMGTM